MSETAVSGCAVRLEGVSKHFGATRVLDAIHLDVPPASFTVLLGQSGCGKTTCLRILAGLETASSGRVLIGGRDVTTAPPAGRGVAMVFQSYALFPHLDVAENIVFGLRARGVARAERRARLARAAEMLGIGHLLARRPAQLSGGQQQRVALGRALVAEAPVCLMDEPLSNLDAQLRADMRREIVGLQRRLGLTMIYVTHDQTEAMSMADQVVVMREGRIEQCAAPAEIYERPASSYVAGFIGAPPMNLFPLEQRGAGLVIRGTGGPALAAAPARAVVGGVRPEALRLAAADEAGAITARVLDREYLGADTVLTCAVGQGELRLLARLPGQVRLAPGSMIGLAADPGAISLFDAATGLRLGHAPSEPQHIEG